MEATVFFYAEIGFTHSEDEGEEYLFAVTGEPCEVGGFDYEFGGVQGFKEVCSDCEVNNIQYYPYGEDSIAIDCPEWILSQVKDIAEQKLREYDPSQELVEEWDL